MSPRDFDAVRRLVRDEPDPADDPFLGFCLEVIRLLGPREAFRRLGLSGPYQAGYDALVAGCSAGPSPRATR